MGIFGREVRNKKRERGSPFYFNASAAGRGAQEDMANMAVALVSERFSAYVTGTTVAVDGGLALYNWIAAAS
ncbi:MAG: hypothetical protein ABIP64_03940 [Burkholderiales bacterium]